VSERNNKFDSFEGGKKLFFKAKRVGCGKHGAWHQRKCRPASSCPSAPPQATNLALKIPFLFTLNTHLHFTHLLEKSTDLTIAKQVTIKNFKI
jgi:hypothetical protein